MMKCVQCSQNLYHSNGLFQVQPAILSTCSACTEKTSRELAQEGLNFRAQVKELQATSRELAQERLNFRAQVKELRATVRFLRHQFGNQPTSGLPEGDVVIMVQGVTDQPLRAHKFILASRSSVFQEIFQTKMPKKETGILRIDDATLPVVRAVIKFCYNAEIDFTNEVTSEEVLQVAHKYGIDLLKRICEEDLTATISEGNLPKRLKLARKFMSTGLGGLELQHLSSSRTTLTELFVMFCQNFASLRLQDVCG